jgi:predicted SAM-dependent methyltransferase
MKVDRPSGLAQNSSEMLQAILGGRRGRQGRDAMAPRTLARRGSYLLRRTTSLASSLWSSRRWSRRLALLRREPGAQVLLHIGCGEINAPGFINIDARPYPHVHIVAKNLYRLTMIPDEAADLVYMCHVLEHVSHRAVMETLREMCRVLKRGGVLRISVPDLDHMIALYRTSGNEVAAIEQPLMGGQDYPFNFHHAVFNRAHLQRLLLASGFDLVRAWDPHHCEFHDFDDWASRSVTWNGKEYPISLNVEAVKQTPEPEAGAMTLSQRVGMVLAREGMTGVLRRVGRRLSLGQGTLARSADGQPIDRMMVEAKAEYGRLTAEFAARTAKLGVEDMKRYYWYHTVDLGNGLITPGDYDYRASLSHFRFPEDMRGMSVLDVGSATGFFAFEFERRGADVVSVELPSIADWDMPSGEARDATLRALMRFHGVETVEAVQHFHLDGPFEFCQRMLHSKVARCHSRIYDLSPAKVGRDGFDLVFIGDMLLHTFSPLAGLAAVAPLCRGTLVMTDAVTLTPGFDDVPVMVYKGGDRIVADGRTWWGFNRLCLEQMLRRVGFRDVALVGRHQGILRREWAPYDRMVVHAIK